jgi:hypothetical protein
MDPLPDVNYTHILTPRKETRKEEITKKEKQQMKRKR